MKAALFKGKGTIELGERPDLPSKSRLTLSFASVMICTCGHTVAVKLPGSVIYNCGRRDAFQLAG